MANAAATLTPTAGFMSYTFALVRLHAAMVFSFLSPKKAMVRLSGDQNGVRPLSVPVSGRISPDSSERSPNGRRMSRQHSARLAANGHLQHGPSRHPRTGGDEPDGPQNPQRL
jgi:hypothetical protein